MIIEVDGQRFDVPDDATPAEIAQITAHPLEARLKQSLPDSEPVGRGEAALRALSSVGTLGFATNLLGARPASRMSDIRAEGAIPDEAKRQQLVRAEKARDQQALRDHPFLSLAVGGPAAALAAPFIGAGQAAPTLLGRLGQAAKVGAGLGAVGGLNRSQTAADIPGNVAFDTVAGGVTGPAVQVVGEAAAPLLRAAGRAAGEVALTQGRKALTGNAGTIGVKKQLSPEAVTAAYESGAIKPLSTIQGIADRLGNAREALGEQYATILAELEARGVTGPNAITLARQLMAEARDMTQTGNPAPDMFRDIARQVIAEPKQTPDFKLPLSTAEEIKRNLQNAARSEYVKEGPTSLAGDAKKQLAARLRQAVEGAVQEQSSLAPEQAAAFVPVKQRLGAIIEASDAANTAAARQARKSSFGLIPTVAASGGLATGGVTGAAAAGAAAKAVQSRGPATLGFLARALEQALAERQAMTPAPAAVRATALSEWERALLEALGAPGLRLTAAGAEENR